VSDRSFGGVELSRAPASASPGPLDDALYDLIEARFRRVVEEEPTWATYLGIHAWDDRLPDPSRERILGDVAEDRAHPATAGGLRQQGGGGLDGTHLHAAGYGETRPVDTNRTEDGREVNRRVDFNLIDAPADGQGEGTP